MLENTCNDFIKELASKSAVPGGGGASAFAGALGIALGAMVGNLSLNKKRYEKFEAENIQLIEDANKLIFDYQSLITKDAECFLPLSKAYGMPKVTDEEIRLREEVLQRALVGAANVPLEIAKLTVRSVDILERFFHTGSRLAISDIGVGIALVKAALQGAKLNVLVNTRLMHDWDMRDSYERELDCIEEKVMGRADDLYQRVLLELST